MISRQDIRDRSGEWQLREDVVEKDYVLGWLLAALGQYAETAWNWVFKGGTCLKKCYFETYRFSEDLDFTLNPGAIYTPVGLRQVLIGASGIARELSGIEFPEDAVSVRPRRDRQGRVTFEGKVGYRGPLAVPNVPRILFDLTQHEPVLVPLAKLPVFHPYPDQLPAEMRVSGYSLEELFAEKTRALLERTRPRDLYDVVFILENRAGENDLVRVHALFKKKCRFKGIEPPTIETFITQVRQAEELRSEWSNMLAHQLPQLPPLDGLLARLPDLLRWIESPTQSHSPGPDRVPLAAGEVVVAPSGVHFWGIPAALEMVRFAGDNRLLVEFEYHGKHRLAEPYSLRRSTTGKLLLYAWERDETSIKAFDTADMRAVRATATPFIPRYRVEFMATGPLSIRNAAMHSSAGGRRSSRQSRRTRAK